MKRRIVATIDVDVMDRAEGDAIMHRLQPMCEEMVAEVGGNNLTLTSRRIRKSKEEVAVQDELPLVPPVVA